MNLQCQVDNDIVYEFPTFNALEVSPGIWSSEDPKFDNPTYGGVRLKTSSIASTQSFNIFGIMFPRIQACLRRYAIQKLDNSEDLFQWFHGSKITNGHMECLITLQEKDNVEIKIRGRKEDSKESFFFLEEILGVIDQVLVEMSPGQSIEKDILSSSDLMTHAAKPQGWNAAGKPDNISEVFSIKSH
jgi:death-associated protein kinase